MAEIKDLLFIGLIIFFFAVIMNAFSLNYTGEVIKEGLTVSYIINNPAEFVNEYNQKFENIPNFIKTLLGTEKINLIIETNNKTKTFSIETKEGKIINYSEKLFEDQTFTVELREETLDRLLSSKYIKNDIANAILTDEIKITPNGFMQTTKLFAGKNTLKIKDFVQ